MSKILFVLESFYPNIGGSETLFYSLAGELVKAGHQVKVITSDGDKFKSSEVIDGIEIERIKSSSRYLFTFFALFPVFRSVKNFDLVQTTSYNAALPAYIASRMRGKKIVITFHEVWGKLWFELPFISKFQAWGFYLFEKLILKLRFDKFIAVSNATAEALVKAGIAEDKVEMIYNGIDYKEISPPKARQPEAEKSKMQSKVFKCLFFGRLGISKGLDLLLPAVGKFHSKAGSLSADRQEPMAEKLKIIAGRDDNNILRWIKKYIAENNLEDVVELLPALSKDKLIEEIQKSDCVIVPSYSEGFCYSAVETIALGTPIIVSNRGALPEVVSGKYMIFNEQTVESLSEAIRKAYRGEWEIKPLKKFELKETVEKYIELVENFDTIK